MKPVRNDSIIILVCLIAIAAFLIGKKVGSKEDYTEVVPEDTVAFQSNWGRDERHSASRAHIYYNVEEQKAERFAFDPKTFHCKKHIQVQGKRRQVSQTRRLCPHVWARQRRV